MSADILFLNNKEMEAAGCSDMKAVLHDVEQAYSLYIKGEAIMPGKVAMPFGHNPEDEYTKGRINCMPGLLFGDYQVAGVKWIGSNPQNFKYGLPRASCTVILNDMETKLPICVCDGTQISAMRTGASGGVAMKYLASANAEVMTICGAGVQGRTQVEAAITVRPSLKTVYVYDLILEHSERFAKESGEKYPNVRFIPVSEDELAKAVGESDIVDTATLAQEPFVQSEWIKKGALIVNMSGYEVADGCVRMADKVVVDFWDTVKHRMHSTVAKLAARGEFADSALHAEIGEIVCGRKAGRESEDETIYFNAVGAGILDLAVAGRCYKTAKEQGLGITVPYWV